MLVAENRDKGIAKIPKKQIDCDNMELDCKSLNFTDGTLLCPFPNIVPTTYQLNFCAQNPSGATYTANEFAFNYHWIKQVVK